MIFQYALLSGGSVKFISLCVYHGWYDTTFYKYQSIQCNVWIFFFMLLSISFYPFYPFTGLHNSTCLLAFASKMLCRAIKSFDNLCGTFFNLQHLGEKLEHEGIVTYFEI